jgi:hypothetical protein
MAPKWHPASGGKLTGFSCRVLAMIHPSGYYPRSESDVERQTALMETDVGEQEPGKEKYWNQHVSATRPEIYQNITQHRDQHRICVVYSSMLKF